VALWLIETSKFLVDSSSTTTKDIVNYTTVGQMCFLNINAIVENGKIELPYTSLFTKKIQVFLDGANTPTYVELGANSAELNIGANGAVVINDWYFAKLAT